MTLNFLEPFFSEAMNFTLPPAHHRSCTHQQIKQSLRLIRVHVFDYSIKKIVTDSFDFCLILVLASSLLIK